MRSPCFANAILKPRIVPITAARARRCRAATCSAASRLAAPVVRRFVDPAVDTPANALSDGLADAVADALTDVVAAPFVALFVALAVDSSADALSDAPAGVLSDGLAERPSRGSRRREARRRALVGTPLEGLEEVLQRVEMF